MRAGGEQGLAGEKAAVAGNVRNLASPTSSEERSSSPSDTPYLTSPVSSEGRCSSADSTTSVTGAFTAGTALTEESCGEVASFSATQELEAQSSRHPHLLAKKTTLPSMSTSDTQEESTTHVHIQSMPLTAANVKSEELPSQIDPCLRVLPSSTLPQQCVGIAAQIAAGERVVQKAKPQPRNTLSQPTTQKPALRRGKWTPEEEAYVARVIADFNSGYLRAPAGTTLRTYLSEKLNCDPMRITKKFTGDACIGKRVFHPAVRCAANAAEIDKAQFELDALEQRWRKRLESQRKDPSRKSNRSSASRSKAQTTPIPPRPPAHAAALSVAPDPSPIAVDPPHPPVDTTNTGSNQEVVTKTASWLERASSVLASRSRSSGNMTEMEDQMKQVQQLIHEGPIIRQTTAVLPDLLDKDSSTTMSSSVRPDETSSARASHDMRKSKSDNGLSTTVLHKPSVLSANESDLLPAAKRKVSTDKDSGTTVDQSRSEIAGAEEVDDGKKMKNDRLAVDPTISRTDAADVEALVGFLNCVRKESLAAKLDTQ